MRTATSPYPPPLSSPPTVEALEGLLAGLKRPLRPGVPTPPTATGPDVVLFEHRPAGSVASQRPSPVDRPSPLEHTAPGLTWSAHHAGPRRGALSPTTVMAVTALAAAVASAVVATGAG